MNRYVNASFIGSADSLSQCPPDHGQEVAFAGRSNVGKSSVINTLCGQNKLARISKVPGRTQLLNFFSITDAIRLVDLPGYGYARVSEKMRQHWGRLLEAYLSRRKSLVGLVLVMDIRNPMKPPDLQLLQWCNAAGLPVCILLNKSDKLSRGAGVNVLRDIERQVSEDTVSAIGLFSVLNGTGVDMLRAQLDTWFGLE